MTSEVKLRNKIQGNESVDVFHYLENGQSENCASPQNSSYQDYSKHFSADGNNDKNQKAFRNIILVTILVFIW